jgi:predicted permease
MLSMRVFLQDLRFANRWLKQSVGFSAVAVLTLGLGMGANTAIFTIMNAVVLRQLPFEKPGELVQIWEAAQAQTAEKAKQLGEQANQINVSGQNFVDWRAQNKTFSQMALYDVGPSNVASAGTALRANSTAVSADFFKVLRADAIRGRAFADADHAKDADDVVVIGYALWRDLFNLDQRALGKSLRVNGRPFVIVGVLPEGFDFPERSALWVPLHNYAGAGAPSRSAKNYLAIGRLRPGVSIEEANSDLANTAAQIAAAFPEQMKDLTVNLVPLHEQIVGQVRPVLAIFAGAVAFVLMIACVNVANLLLARAQMRSREMAVRAALGASRWRLVRQLLTESLLLAVCGGVAGLLMLVFGLRLLKNFLPANLPRVETISADWRVLGFTLLLTLLTTVLFGLLPSFQATGMDLTGTLKGGGLGVTRSRLGGWLVAGEVGAALLLLIGAGLLIKSFDRLQNIDVGYSPECLVVANLSLPTEGIERGPARIAAAHAYVRQMVERVAALPGVTHAATASTLLAGDEMLASAGGGIEGRSQGTPEQASFYVWHADYEVVTPGYFDTVNVRVLRGRGFTDRDDETSPEVMIINEAAAKRFWKDEDPVGQRVVFPGMSKTRQWVTIVGVVSDVRQRTLDRDPQPTAYTPHAQNAYHLSYLTLVARVRAVNPGIMAAIKEQVRHVSSEIPVEIKPADAMIAQSLARQRFQRNVLIIFAVLALTLSAIGVFGLLSHVVEQRTREIGIRLAVGAQTDDIVWLFVERGMKLCLLGLALGLAASLALTRVISAYLFGVKPTDPVVFSLTAFLLFVVAVAATYLPARRASRVDPVDSLRAN